MLLDSQSTVAYNLAKNINTFSFFGTSMLAVVVVT